MDLEKFVKTIALTDSSFDGEILNAIKKCNQTLKQENLRWSDVVGDMKMLNEKIQKLENNEREFLDYIWGDEE